MNVSPKLNKQNHIRVCLNWVIRFNIKITKIIEMTKREKSGKK